MKGEGNDQGKDTRPDLKLISSQGARVPDPVHPKRKHLDELAETLDEDILLADGYDDAILGYTDSWGGDNRRCMKAVYDRRRCIEILMEDMVEGDAEEYFEFNVAGAYVGPNTPIFVELFK